MLSAFAVTPGAFDPATATNPELLDCGIASLGDLCRNEGVFLDLRDGDWGGAIDRLPDEAGAIRAREFREFAHKRRRLVRAPKVLPNPPDDEQGWLWEAQRVGQEGYWKDRLKGVVTGQRLATEYQDDPAVVSVEALNRTAWWTNRSSDVVLHQCFDAYKAQLNVVLKHANLLMFIDPYILPEAPGSSARLSYEGFLDLLLEAGSKDRYPTTQIHRADWLENKQNRLPNSQWKQQFEPWSRELRKARRSVEVLFWHEIHARYLVSDIVAISLHDGFRAYSDARTSKSTRWSRLGTDARENLQREYEEGGDDVHKSCGKITIGIT
jgi:hypothetical protein